MTVQIIPTPEMVLAIGDPGDDTAQRYRYQWAYAAIVCCLLLDDTESVAEVFCEHHEDILIKYADGMFAGLQVKTRSSNQEVWKANDESLKNAFVRFVKLEYEFPDQFRTFRFLTNHPLHTAENGKSIGYVLRQIKKVYSVNDLSGSVAKFVTLIGNEAGCTKELAFTALSKADASDDLPKLSDIEARLVSTLTDVWNRAADCSFAAVKRAARSLVTECERASSLAHMDVLPAYLPASIDPVGAELAARIAGKRINRSLLLEHLKHGLDERATLDGEPETITTPGIGSPDLLLKKLDAGCFSAVSRNSAADLRDKADYLGLKWINKHGREDGLQRYGHVRSLVLSDAARAFEDTKGEEENQRFGLQMLSELRSRFQQRRVDGSQLYECSNEHLEGFAYSLTSECKVQWSLTLPWEVT